MYGWYNEVEAGTIGPFKTRMELIIYIRKHGTKKDNKQLDKVIKLFGTADRPFVVA